MPTTEAEGMLLAARAADGGWPYKAGLASRVEPTALAALALGPASPASSGARAWLARAQQRDGSWSAAEGASRSAWPTPLAMLALAADPAGAAADRITRATRFLLSARPAVLEDAGPVKLRGTLRGWAWTADAFSWVEPTSYAILALKKCFNPDVGAGDSGAGPGFTKDLRARLGEAEAMLRDRMCEGGGWNFGNPAAFGVPIRAFPVPTAVALIALQDDRGHPGMSSSLAILSRIATAEPSMLGLGWALAALRIFGVAGSEVEEGLARECSAVPGRDTGPDVPSLAMAALARADDDRLEALRL